MRKYVLTAVVVAMMSSLALSLLAQGPPAPGQGRPPAGQAPGGQAPGGARGFGGGMVNPDSVNAAVAEIEKQVAALKKAMEGATAMPGPAPGTAGQADQKPVMGGSRGGGASQAMMAANQKRTAAVRAAAAAIADQALVLKGNQAQTEQDEEAAELQSIVDLANKEKATATAALAKQIIDERQKAFTEKATKLGIGLRGGMMGNRGGGFTPPPGGFKYLDNEPIKK